MTTTPRLAWTRIKEIFEAEWIELVDFDWKWEHSYPTWAKVRHHAATHAELLHRIEQSPAVDNSIVLYVAETHTLIQHEASAAAL